MKAGGHIYKGGRKGGRREEGRERREEGRQREVGRGE